MFHMEKRSRNTLIIIITIIIIIIIIKLWNTKAINQLYLHTKVVKSKNNGQYQNYK